MLRGELRFRAVVEKMIWSIRGKALTCSSKRRILIEQSLDSPDPIKLIMQHRKLRPTNRVTVNIKDNSNFWLVGIFSMRGSSGRKSSSWIVVRKKSSFANAVMERKLIQILREFWRNKVLVGLLNPGFQKMDVIILEYCLKNNGDWHYDVGMTSTQEAFFPVSNSIMMLILFS